MSGYRVSRVRTGGPPQLPNLQLKGPVDDIVWTRSRTDPGRSALHVIW